MSIITKDLEYGDKPKNLINTFFDILKNMTLENQEKGLSTVKTGIEQKIGLTSKSTEN